jgi:hypothetical protein
MLEQHDTQEQWHWDELFQAQSALFEHSTFLSTNLPD